MEVKGLVSDRARALVKLGKSAYLGVVSMPDLFHFNQDIVKAAGLQIGKKRAKAKKTWEAAKETGKDKLKTVFEGAEEVYQSYRAEMGQINKTVHPFNEQDEWTDAPSVEKGLLHCFTAIGRLASQLGIEIGVSKANKVLQQIGPIAKGIEAWINQTKSEVSAWVTKQVISEQEKEWLVQYALPYQYWQLQLSRTGRKLRTKELRTYYKERVSKAEVRCQTGTLTKEIPLNRQEELLLLAHRLAISFQRASSQTEGRNGYLSFVNHAHKGFPNGRLPVLTVIHNYDIKRADGSTPAQRLFNKDFPDLFEFLCQHVTGFKEPRSRKAKSLKTNILQP